MNSIFCNFNFNTSNICIIITDKYIKKRWVNPKMKLDPASLFLKDQEKFAKYVASLRGQAGNNDEEEAEQSKEARQLAKQEKRDKKKKKHD